MLCFGKVHQHSDSNEAWKQRIEWIITEKKPQRLTESTESRRNSSGTSSQDSLRCGSADRSGQFDVLMGQSIVLSDIKAEVPLKNDIPSHQNLLLQRYEERINLISQENKVSKFCMDAGFIHVVEIGQYFMTKDIEEQFFARVCR